jgi:hypothetical protein
LTVAIANAISDVRVARGDPGARRKSRPHRRSRRPARRGVAMSRGEEAREILLPTKFLRDPGYGVILFATMQCAVASRDLRFGDFQFSEDVGT